VELERTLLELYRFGKPVVFSAANGWRVSVDLNVNATGAKFEVTSDHGFATPTLAANQCLERVHQILSGIRDGLTALENLA